MLIPHDFLTQCRRHRRIMSGVNKSYLPSRRIMPVYTTVSPPATGAPGPAFPYDAPQVSNSTPPASSVYTKMQPTPKMSPTAPYTKGPEFPYDPPDLGPPGDYHYAGLQNGTKSSQSAATSAVVAAAAASAAGFSRLSDSVKAGGLGVGGYPARMQEFPYGLSGVAMPNYNYSSELYSYVSNGFPRKSRMCSYCGKVFTRSTTRRYHEKRCPLLRAAGSLMKTSESSRHAAIESSRQAAIESSRQITIESSRHAAPSPANPPTMKASFSDTSLSSYCSNTSLPPISPHTPYYAHFPPPYASTSVSTVMSATNQNRDSMSDVKTEPCDPADLSSPMVTGSQVTSGEVSTTRFTPEYDSASLQPTRALFSPVTDSRASTSPVSMAAESIVRPGSSDADDTDAENNDLERAANDDAYTASCRSHGDHDDSYTVTYHSHGDRTQQPDLSISGSRNGSYHSQTQGKTSDTGQIGDEKDNTKNEYVAERRSALLAHAHAHAHSLANRCSICGKVFETARQLHAHEQLHTKFKPYACRFCGQRFIKVSMRIAHERIHIGEKPYVCAICGLTFTRKYSVRLHMRRRHTEGPCLCRYCGKTVYSLQALKTHLLAHNLPKSEKESLFYLNVSPHTDKPETTSKLTAKPGDTQEATEADGMGGERAEDSVEQEWCKLCEKVFPKSFMRYHERIHADQKPYECPTCKKRFGYKNNMKSHMKLHAGVKPYQCHVCGAKFTRGSTLRRHARRHGIFSDSVWDFFVQKRKAAKKEEESTQQPPDEGGPGSPEVSSSRSVAVDGGGVDSGRGYEPLPFTSLPDSTGTGYSNFAPGVGAMSGVGRGLYYSYPSSSAFSVQYSSYIPSQAPQADALNLSIHDNQDKPKCGDICESNMEDVQHTPSDHISHPGSPSPQERSSSSSSCDVAVQVNLCCCGDQLPPLLSASSLMTFNPRLLTPEEADGSLTSRTSPLGVEGSQASPRSSPSLGGSVEVNLQESMSSLLGSGRLFRCAHCECFFSEYAMYRVHQKLHARGDTQPFACPTCGEDCHDRMYFSLHLLEHLR